MVRKRKTGLPPGSLVYTGDSSDDYHGVTLYSYDQEKLSVSHGKSFQEVISRFNSSQVNWLNVIGLTREEKIAEIGKHFGINILLLEDILNVNQLPKFEEFNEYIFISLKMLRKGSGRKMMEEEHLSLVMNKNCVISFQEREGDIFENFRERLKVPDSRTRKLGSDYLLYRLIDITVDHYYLFVDEIFEKGQAIESLLLNRPRDNRSNEILQLRKSVMELRRAVYPLRDAVKQMKGASEDLILPATKPFYNDVIDHLNHITQGILEAEELLRSCMDLQMANQNNSLNNVMKVLTVVSTVFIPLTFLSGIYGMNFKHMPELDAVWGYPVLLGIMLLVAVGMLAFFKKKGWF